MDIQQAIQFADTLLMDGEMPGSWSGKKYLIGMHDKWLTEAEADNKIIFFSGITDAHYYTHYLQHEANLIRLYLMLHATDALLLFQEGTKQFVTINSVSELIQIVTLGVRELAHYILYSPALHTLFVDAHDVASVAYVLDGEDIVQAQATITRLADANDLYALR